ncbi:MAG: PQQ-binding-like beta-propeller repeat protein [Phycisphaerales bacterium]
MGEQPELLYAAVGRTVAALDRHTGRPVWQVKLPKMFRGNVAMIVPHDEELYVGRGGYIYCLDRHTGTVLWERGVASSSGMVLLALTGAESVQQQAMLRHQAASDEGGAGAAAGAAAAG